ncbi:cob(I)yrinic acid a,c-diamide adenosyltransferase [Pedobacter sp. JY14-1]|uniref:cob(I)yrinic acid a,c-diamide adenosyltransferase n=1 Tax=Pedobacter sp. JY14-1 TaxID=3034151 RepID=UPI0023E13993|nr:cob(I)yrinic acid a,c-diamide adenosyltransferase [Pedobacter sp. JY14-1]
MKIYTRTGDKGQTSLIGGTRVPKYHHRIECYGTIDELNSYIGLLRCQEMDTRLKAVLAEIQDRLFTIGSLLAADPGKSTMVLPGLIPGDVELLENEIDRMEAGLPSLKHFILPGGNTASSFCHIARCICRRAERLIVQLAENSDVDEKMTVYLNRLSDYLFVLARKLSSDGDTDEIVWKPRR